MSTPSAIDSLVTEGLAHFHQQDFVAALRSLDAAITSDENYARAWCARGMVWHRRSDFDKAIRDYEMAIKLDGGYARAYFNRGLLRLERGDPESALLDFDTAIEIDREARFFSNEVRRSQC